MIATTIEQSNKLLALGIDPSTADMFYRDNGEDLKLMWELVVDKPKYPAWSLSALLDLIPQVAIMQNVDKSYDITSFDKRIASPTHWIENIPNLIDACIEMIIWLKENKCI